MEGKWVTPSGEGQQCVCEETSQEAFSHSQQTLRRIRKRFVHRAGGTMLGFLGDAEET